MMTQLKIVCIDHADVAPMTFISDKGRDAGSKHAWGMELATWVIIKMLVFANGSINILHCLQTPCTLARP
jgi:hypothetical protein